MIGIVGLGLLGHAVASRLTAARHRVLGYDVVEEKREALKALGGDVAASAADVARAADIVCTILPSLDAVERVILREIAPHAKPGTTVVQMSTISPSLTEKLAREVTAQGLGFLDCPISGTSGMVEKGNGIIFVGGERTLFDTWQPTLEAVLPRAVYIGKAGQAMTLKLVANLLVALNSAAAAEALLMVKRAGLDATLALEVLGTSAASSSMLQVRGPMIVHDAFPAQMKLDLFMKDLHLIQDAARAVGTPLPLTDVAERLYASVAERGHGGEDLAVVVRALEHMTGARP